MSVEQQGSADRLQEDVEELASDLRSGLQPRSVAALLRLSDVLSRTETLGALAEQVPEVARAALDADHAAVGLSEPDGDHLQYLDPDGLPEDPPRPGRQVPLAVPSPVADAVRTRRPVVFARLADAVHAHPTSRDELVAAGLETTAHVPLVTAGSVVGVLDVAWREPRPLGRLEHDVMQALGGFIAQAVARIQMIEQRRSSAETLQRSLLTHLPVVDGLELSARYVPAAYGEEVGGDWYDVVRLPDGSAACVIGDVAGHDMAAAAAMGQVRGLLRAFAVDRDEGPGDLVHRLERAMVSLDLDVLVTLVVLRAEPLAAAEPPAAAEAGPGSGFRLRWTNAGHPPPLLLRPDGSTELLETEPELLIGLLTGSTRSDHDLDLPAGATVLLYTDGLVERRGRSLTDGIEELRDVLSRLAGKGLDELLDELVVALVGAHPDDDCALLAIRGGGGSSR
ncbi:serine phosphatase RsbU (regulator of sigma subunit) [Kineococcus xinjiangensis]|uniref:Serine phosphatase RsbU (Regulator of sigma subunit) n=1 Tax=Kineococcus xinjiangensis TaxID=512762 RepID=A0A2S6ICZ6_9ACTN|nr:GAF domain-containing SpoIIE family protein phosphatase [Kineococcus xinjiangensis]PPK92094.1 serine phosphatase RsbU (regulator of sigma subunit) [Kineococcus xinjiangensis]